jgi:hypothetical protein
MAREPDLTAETGNARAFNTCLIELLYDAAQVLNFGITEPE